MKSNHSAQTKFTKAITVFCVLGYGGAAYLFSSIEAGFGNGGSFLAMLCIVLVCFTALLTTVLGIFACYTSIATKSYLKQGIFNSFWLPFLISLPTVLFLWWKLIENGMS
jgi:hypothetical protein